MQPFALQKNHYFITKQPAFFHKSYEIRKACRIFVDRFRRFGGNNISFAALMQLFPQLLMSIRRYYLQVRISITFQFRYEAA